MADTVGSAEFLVKVRDMVTGPMKQIGASVGGTLKQIATYAAGNLLADGIRRATAAAQGFLAQGIETNAEFEKLNNSFSVMLSSQRKAAVLMADLQKFAAETPFEMQGLAKAAASLLATKQVGRQEVIPMLRSLGDAAAASTEGFEAMPRVVRAISQMLSKGKLQAEEMMQLAEAGVPAWQILADKMKKSSAEVQKLASGGKLGVKEIRLLVDGLGDRFKGLADKQSKTFTGLMSTMRDNAAMAAAQITKPIYDHMTKVMQGLTKGMSTKAFTASVETMASAVKYVVDLVEKISASPLTKVVVEVAAIAAGLIAAGAALAWVPTLYGLAAGLAPAVVAIGAITAAAAGLAVLIRNAFAGQEGEKFRAKLAEIWSLIKEIGANLRDAVMPIVQRVGAAIAGAFGQSGALQAGFNSFLGTVLGGLRTILDYVSLFTNDFGKSWEFVKVSAAAAISYIGDIMRHVFLEQAPNMAVALVESLLTGIDEVIVTFFEMTRALTVSFAELSTAVSQLFSSIPGVVVSVFSFLTQEAHGFVNDLLLGLKDMFTSLSTFVVEVFSSIFSALIAQLGHAIEAGKKLAGADVRGALDHVKAAAVDVPKILAGQVGKAGANLLNNNKGFIDKTGERAARANAFVKEQIEGPAKLFKEQIVAAGNKFADTMGGRVATGMKNVADMFNNIRGLVPGLEKSPITKMLDGMAANIWRDMRVDRNGKRNERFMENLGLKEIPGNIGKGLADLIVGGGKGFFGGVEDMLEIFHKKPAAAEEKKKKKAEFVGLADMNKKIQVGLTKEDKNAKAQLKAVQQGAAAAQKGAAAGEKLFGAVNGVKEAIGKVMLGFGK